MAPKGKTTKPASVRLLRSPAIEAVIVAAVLCLITGIAYWNSFTAGFPFDNATLILQDTRIRAATPENLDLILGHTYWWPSNDQSGLYRPLTTLSYLVNYAVFGNQTDPAGYHWVNLILHDLNVVLAFFLVFHFCRSKWPSALAAGLWAVHPVLTESVTNIVGRADLLSGAAILGGVLLYVKGDSVRGWRNVAWLGGLGALSAIGAFSKESGVVLFGVLLAYEAIHGKRRRGRLMTISGLAAVLLPALWMLYERAKVMAASSVMAVPFVDNPLVDAGFWTGKLSALTVLGRYLWVVLWPRHLYFDYSYPAVALISGKLADWLAGASVIAMLAIAYFLARRNRTCLFFLVFSFLTLLPASNLLFPIGTIMAERLLYLPCLGLIFCLVTVAYRTSGRMAPVILCALLAALTIRTIARNFDWNSDLTLSAAAVDAHSQSYKAHLLLAESLFSADPDHSRITEAVSESDRSVGLIASLPDAESQVEPYRASALYHYIRAQREETISARADYEAALRSIQRAIGLTKNHTNWEALRRSDLAGFYSEAGRMAFGTIYRLESSIYLHLDNHDQALADAIAAREYDPLEALTYRAIAEALEAAGRYDDGAEALMEGVMLTSDPYLRQSLGKLCRKSPELMGCVHPRSDGDVDLNMSCAAMHRTSCSAASELLQIVTDAGRADLAIKIRALGEQQLGCGISSASTIQ